MTSNPRHLAAYRKAARRTAEENIRLRALLEVAHAAVCEALTPATRPGQAAPPRSRARPAAKRR